ncbi:MAG: CoA pyrophosphatase [Candidatus Dormibacteraeota bacterium]|nr:CoA pyrophosphatase [Candidatus Dormibacteraeota bacterium]
MDPASVIEELRRTLPARPPAANPRWSLEGRVDAAVAVPLQPAGDDLVIWLTKRPPGMRHHAGEVSFPGGKRERYDPTLLSTALRELEEEVGVPATAADVLGTLGPAPTATSRFLLNPFVIALPAGLEPRPSPREVASVVRLSLDGVIEARVPFRAIEFGDHRSPIFDLGGRAGSVYGATAYVLEDILRRCAAVIHRTLPEPSLAEEIPWQ